MIKNGKQKRQGFPCLFCVDWSDSAEIAANSAENAGHSAKWAEQIAQKVWYNTVVATGGKLPESGRRRLLQKRQTVMKIQLILLLYDELIMGKSIERSRFCEEHEISERTFYRYLHEITDFLRAYKQAYIVDMREPGGRYYLKKIVDL